MKPSTETFEATIIDDVGPTKQRSKQGRALLGAWVAAAMAAAAHAPGALTFWTENGRWRTPGQVEARPSPEELEAIRERARRGMPLQRLPTGSERERKAAAKRARRAAKAGRG